jgi:orotate phosphoribosyltransferase
MGPLFYYNRSKLRNEIADYLKIPSVFKTSIRLYRGGKQSHYYIDFDLIINDPHRCDQISKAYAATIVEISKKKQVDLLGFIEKASGGTFGAVRLAGFISYLSNVPNVLIRLTRELEYEQVKLPIIIGKTLRERLASMKIIIITDHISTGTELLDAVDAIEFNGGKVTDVIAYTKMTDIVKKEEFANREITLHSLLELPEDLPSDLKEIAISMVH